MNIVFVDVAEPRGSLLALGAVADAGMKELGRLKYLYELRLPETAVTDAGLAHLAGLKLSILEVRSVRSVGDYSSPCFER